MRTKQTCRKSTGLPPPPRRRRLEPDSDSEDDSAADGEEQELPAEERISMESLLRGEDWVELSGGSRGLAKDFSFNSFNEAWAFMNRLALRCELRRFFPKLTVQYTTVTVTLAHGDGDAAGITRKGFEFARFADSAAETLAI